MLLDRGFYDMEVIENLKRNLKFLMLVPKYDAYRDIMGRGSGVYEYSTNFPKGNTSAMVSFLFAVVLDHLKYDWLFATNIRFENLRAYVRLYKGRWGIETTFRVQDVESLLYTLWVFFSAGVGFSEAKDKPEVVAAVARSPGIRPT